MGNKKNRNKEKVQGANQLPSLYVVTPSLHSDLSVHYLRTILGLQRECTANGIKMAWGVVAGQSVLPQARNQTIAKFLSTGCSHVLLLDADVGVRAIDVIACLISDQEFTALPYPKRGMEMDRAAKLIAAGHELGGDVILSALSQPAFVLDGNPEAPEEPMRSLNFVRASHVGTGAMVLKREVFDKFQKAFPGRTYNEYVDSKPVNTFEYFRYTKNEDNFFVGEDYTFCNDWRSIGGEIWLKVDAETTHMSSIELRWNLPIMNELARRVPEENK